jgi:hypothetical protein
LGIWGRIQYREKKGPRRALFSSNQNLTSAIDVAAALLAGPLIVLLGLLLSLLPALLALLLSGLLAGTLLILALLLLTLLARLLARLVVLVHAFLRGWVLSQPLCVNRFRLPPVPKDPGVPKGFSVPVSGVCPKGRRACFRGCNMMGAN